jgi:hypothetical protein
VKFGGIIMPIFFDEEEEDSHDSDLPQGYDTAQICRNGHLITEFASTYPEHKKDHCTKCSAETIDACENCGQAIQGIYHAGGLGAIGKYTKPKYCHNCGKPYPWTELQIQAAKKIIDQLNDLVSSEREDLKNAIDDIVKDTPDAKPAAYKIKTALSKIREEAQAMLRDLIIEIASESIVKIIMPNR